jgi:hypothetical protein
MNVWIWGPNMWDVLHSCAVLYDNHAMNAKELLWPLTQILPCKYCRDSFNEFYAGLGDPAIGRAVDWVYEVHALVNQKLAQQRLQKFIEKHSIDRAAAQSMLAYGSELYAQPSLEVVKKRFLVQIDEPLTWKSCTLTLLAILMNGPNLAYARSFIDALLRAAIWTSSNGLITLLEKLKAQNDVEAMLKVLRRAKYGKEDTSSVMKASSCLKGSCT